MAPLVLCPQYPATPLNTACALINVSAPLHPDRHPFVLFASLFVALICFPQPHELPCKPLPSADFIRRCSLRLPVSNGRAALSRFNPGLACPALQTCQGQGMAGTAAMLLRPPALTTMSPLAQAFRGRHLKGFSPPWGAPSEAAKCCRRRSHRDGRPAGHSCRQHE